MSTNPFRRTNSQHDADGQPSSAAQDVLHRHPRRPSELSVETKVPPGSMERHVSFASPPVDGSYAAISYPSSPETSRYPSLSPVQSTTSPSLNYRSAFFTDPFSDLERDRIEDQAINAALHNTNNNVIVGKGNSQRSNDDAVKGTLGRFARAPKAVGREGGNDKGRSTSSRQSLDVNAFTRLLLTGQAGQPLAHDNEARSATTSSSETRPNIDSRSNSQGSVQISDLEASTRLEHSMANDEMNRLPPPTPAPRRGKSVKQRTASGSNEAGGETSQHGKTPNGLKGTIHQRTEDINGTEVTANAQVEQQKATSIPPPPPPIRRHNSSARRRSSTDLESTAEEFEPEQLAINGSRRSSNERPKPPPSRGSSTSMKRQSIGLQPPPLPPPRRGRGSSRSSMDSFRPSLSSITGEAKDGMRGDGDHGENAVFSSRDILAELASLQAEVDAARRGA